MEYLAGIVIALGVSISATVVGLLSLALMVNVGRVGSRRVTHVLPQQIWWITARRPGRPVLSRHIPHPCG